MRQFFRSVKRILFLFKEAALKFNEDHGTLTAAAVSFYALLSLLPLLLLGVSVFAFVLGSSDQAFSQVVGYLRNFLPSGETFIESTLQSLVKARGVIGIIGLIALLWTGSQIFVTLEIALKEVWDAKKTRGLVKSRLMAIGMVLVAGAFFMLSIGATFFVAIIQKYRIPLLGLRPQDIPYFLRILSVLISLLFSAGLFYMVYQIIPSVNVQWKSAAFGAIVASIIWELAKRIYELYLVHGANYSKVYGSLGNMIILILWMYYTAIILLYCGELAYVHQIETTDTGISPS